MNVFTFEVNSKTGRVANGILGTFKHNTKSTENNSTTYLRFLSFSLEFGACGLH